jgi:hypothetical protein
MTKHIACFAGILALIIAITITSLAQDNNTTMNSTANNTTLNASLIIAPPSVAQNSTASTASNNTTTITALGNTSPRKTVSVDKSLNQTARNLSTVNNATLVVAPITEMAKKAPEVAAAASSVQVAYAPEGALKLGSNVGGWNPFTPTHKEVESQELGTIIKPMRDTEKMFFVCDIV